MRGFEVPKVLVVKNLVKDAIGVPGRAAADEFTISSCKRVEDGVVEVLVVSYKVELIRINHIKCWASDCFRVVRESFNAASVNKADLGFLGLKDNAWW